MTIQTITATELQKRLETEEVNVIDVRELEEVKEGKIPQAKHISLSTLPVRLYEFDPQQEYVMVCRSGARSERACELLQSNGYRVINMVGGMSNWEGPVA